MARSMWDKIELVVAAIIILVMLALFGKVYVSDQKKKKFDAERAPNQPLIY